MKKHLLSLLIIALFYCPSVLLAHGTGPGMSGGTGPISVTGAAAGLSDPMTTRGDVIIRNSSNVTARLGVGANNEVLISDGTDISWGAQTGSGAFSDAGDPIVQNTTTKDVVIGTAAINTSKLSIDGDADQVQFTVQFNATQTDSGVIYENSAGTEIFTFDNDGSMTGVGTGTFGSLQAGSGTPDIEFTTDGNGKITIAAINQTNNETWTIDLETTADTVIHGGTGVTHNFSALTGFDVPANSIDSTEMVNASVTVSGSVELTIASEVTTGTSAVLAVTPDSLAGSDYGKRIVSILANDSTALTTADGKAYFRIPPELNGWNLVYVAAAMVAGTAEVTFDIYNVTQATDTLTTALTIDANETDSLTAAVAAVINTAEDDMTTGDRLRIDATDGGTGTTWSEVQMAFQLP